MYAKILGIINLHPQNGKKGKKLKPLFSAQNITSSGKFYKILEDN